MEDLLRSIQKEIEKEPSLEGFLDFYSVLHEEELLRDQRHKWCEWLYREASRNIDLDYERMYEIYSGALKMDAAEYLDSYMLFIELKRPPRERFYQPRRKILKPIVDEIQKLIDGELKELFISCPPRIGKSTLVTMMYTWILGKYPEQSNLYVSYSATITSKFYDGILEIIQDPDTYLWHEVFPTSKVVHTDSKESTININRNKKYPSMTCRSLYGTLNGACDCTGVLCADDLISGIEEAMNPSRLMSAWSKVDNNMLTRDSNGMAKLLWIGTRWSIMDPIGRRIDLLENDRKYDNWNYKVITMPAINEKGESNFVYDFGLGYDTDYYEQRRASFEHNSDLASWFSQYQQTPIEREGALFVPETMRYYNGVLPDDISKVFVAVDPAFGGGDFVAAPICVKSDEDIYVCDVVYNDSDKSVTIPELVSKVLKYGAKEVRFGVNKMTVSYKDEFQRQLRAAEPGFKVSVTTKADTSQMSKAEKIYNNAPDIRDRMVFLESKLRSKEYESFMQNVFGFTALKKSKQHDDAPDSLAMAIDMDMNPYGMYRILKRPF